MSQPTSLKTPSRKKLRCTENLMSISNLVADEEIDQGDILPTTKSTSKKRRHVNELSEKRVLRSTIIQSCKDDKPVSIKKVKKRKSNKVSNTEESSTETDIETVQTKKTKKSSFKICNNEEPNTETDIETVLSEKAKKKRRKKTKNPHQTERLDSNEQSGEDQIVKIKKNSRRKNKKIYSNSESDNTGNSRNEQKLEDEGNELEKSEQHSEVETKDKDVHKQQSIEGDIKAEEPVNTEVVNELNTSVEKLELQSTKRVLVRSDAIDEPSCIYSDISGCEELKDNQEQTLPQTELSRKSFTRSIHSESTKENIVDESTKALNNTQSLSINTTHNNTMEVASTSFANRKSIEKPFKKRKSNKNISLEEQNSKISSTSEIKTPESDIPIPEPSTTSRKKWNSTQPEWYETLKNISPSCSANSSINNVNEVSNSTSFSICDISAIKNDDKIVPSTNGTPIQNRRNTFELEESVTDVSILKKMSESLHHMSSSEKEDTTFSGVTVRRKNANENVVANTPGRNLSANTKRTSFGRISRSLSNTPIKEISKTRTSTPLQKRKSQNLLKDVLTKDKMLFENISDVSNISNVSVSKKFRSKIKTVPNFAAIHQKAAEKLEDISQYQQRKTERAQFLLSGQKPVSKVSTPASKQSKKQLRFAGSTEEREKPSTYIPLPSTPKPKHVPQISDDSPGPSKLKFGTPKLKVGLSNNKFIINHGEENKNGSSKLKFGTPKFKVGTPKINFSTKLAEDNKNASKNDVQKFKHRIPVKILQIKNKENCSQANEVEQNVLHVKDNKKTNLKEKYKTIVSKEKSYKPKVDERRIVLQGVRLNRRFELLMKMRNN